MNEIASDAMPGTDERRSAAIAASRVEIPPYAKPAREFALVRHLLRSPTARQDLPLTGEIPGVGQDQLPVIMLDGDLHRERRSSLARFFSPKAIKEHHRAVMEASTTALIADLRGAGRGQLDLMSMHDKELLLGWTRGLFLDHLSSTPAVNWYATSSYPSSTGIRSL